MQTILFGLLGLLALTVIVVIHELGHFIAAKKSGVLVEEFGIGLPPRIWGKKIGETIYSINWLPIGGFVRLHGEVLEEAPKYPKRAFSQAAAYKRIIIALAGISMNFLLAIVCFTIVYSVIGVVNYVETGKVTITNVDPQTPAQSVGIIAGDVVTKVNDTQIYSSDEFVSIVNQNKGQKVKITIDRTVNQTHEEKIVTVTPRDNPPEGQGALGIAVTSQKSEVYYPPLWQRPIIGFQESLKQTYEFSKAIISGFAQITTQVSQGQSPQGVVGVTGILALFAFSIKEGLVSLLNFVGLVSVNLAIFNLIPFPPLDGSRVMFVIIEKLIGRKYLPKIEGYAHSIGFIILLGIMILVTAREIPQLIHSGGLNKFVDSLIQ